jgi:hypothetical protein
MDGASIKHGRALAVRPAVLAALLLGLTLAAAGLVWLRGQQSVQPSGQVDCGVGGSNQPWVANCLFEAYSKGQIAKGALFYKTVEGDSVTYEITVGHQSGVEVLIDNRDRFGQPGVYHYSCVRIARSDGPQDTVQLSLLGCSGNGPSPPGGTLSVPS